MSDATTKATETITLDSGKTIPVVSDPPAGHENHPAFHIGGGWSGEPHRTVYMFPHGQWVAVANWLL
jgi:hypothetical protein